MVAEWLVHIPIKWDGRDQLGNAVPTGLYFYTLTDGATSITKKMALMK